ncbi:uncharacterized protein EI90DRAFT_523804 [Cantharellus anzutake]|uniref:uncharacterized protein n=1 Tax=Cantharellus anzutake TaxID=1750568 RepID=UPI001907D719|nr:uncharacterized protein EI90DRAFT_523804 [Cantharellus anzutake]KAF8334205.1 hypothetical protein EI90DRAFT_523804 [Cantharellus anzutake]
MVQIPPVPPLPKAYQSPSAPSFTLPAVPTSPPVVQSNPTTPAEDPDRTLVLPVTEVPPVTPSKSPGRGPTKKWSFSALLPHSSSKDNGKSPLSPKATRGTRTNGHSSEHKGSIDNWSIIESPGTSQNRLHPSTSNASLHPIPSTPSSPTPASTLHSRTPERGVPSRAETSSSASTQTTSQAAHTVTSPPSKAAPNPRRLTPSNIPFFRRSSSSSMQTSIVGITSPSPPPAIPHHISSASISTLASKSTPNNSLELDPTPPAAPPPRKTSVLSLLKPREKDRKDDKDRSESRISILMGRRRGKTLSAAEPKPPKPMPIMPPIQMPGIPASASSRVGSIKVRESVASMPPPSSTRARISGVVPRSPATKTSDSSLRSTRQNLPPIAGSPSVGTTAPPQGVSVSYHPPCPGLLEVQLTPRRRQQRSLASPAGCQRCNHQLRLHSSLPVPYSVTGGPAWSLRALYLTSVF